MLDHHGANRQHQIAAHVKAAGFQVEDDETLLLQRLFVECCWRCQVFPALQLCLRTVPVCAR